MRIPGSLSESIMLGFVNEFVERELRRAVGELRHRGISEPRLLDVGCGRQPYRSLVQELGFVYASMDVAARDVPLDIQAALDDPQLPTKVPPCGYHLLLLTEVLEHVDDQRTAWANLRHLAAADSIVILTTPFLYPLHEEPHDACRPTYFLIDRLAAQVGFTVSEARKAGTASDVLGLVLANLQLPAGRGILAQSFGWCIWLICRLSALLLVRTGLFNLLGTKFYVSNLVRCERFAARRGD